MDSPWFFHVLFMLMRFNDTRLCSISYFSATKLGSGKVEFLTVAMDGAPTFRVAISQEQR
jgi:hypothetical protein